MYIFYLMHFIKLLSLFISLSAFRFIHVCVAILPLMMYHPLLGVSYQPFHSSKGVKPQTIVHAEELLLVP